MEEYVNVKDLHEYYGHEFIRVNGKLDEFIENTDRSDNRDFKMGALWGIAMFLLSVTVDVPKVTLKAKRPEDVLKSEDLILIDELLKLFTGESDKSFDEIVTMYKDAKKAIQEAEEYNKQQKEKK